MTRPCPDNATARSGRRSTRSSKRSAGALRNASKPGVPGPRLHPGRGRGRPEMRPAPERGGGDGAMSGPAADRDGEFLLEARDIVKRFGDFTANDRVTLRLRPGRIHALLGENGAGKSTLVKIIYGALQPTAGELRWHGEPVTVANPAAARRLGIGMVFQHFSLFEALSVAENIALAMPGAFDPRRARRAGRPGVGGVRPPPGADRARRGPLGRRAPAHRDRALPPPGPPPAHHGRADRGAHPRRRPTSSSSPCAASRPTAARCSTSRTGSKR